MTATIRTWLDAQDGPLFAAAILGAVVALILLCALYNALAKVDRQPRPRRESMSERHDRLDRKAAAAAAARANQTAFDAMPKEYTR